MRRLKSTYTLLSGESSPSRREAAAAFENGGQQPFQQFSWPQILSAESSPIASDIQDQEDSLSGEQTPLDISSADSESCYGTTGQFNETVHPDPLLPHPMVTTYGSVTIMLRHLVRIDLSPEGAVYVQNVPGDTIAVINSTGDKSCIIHSNSRVYQDGQDVHVMTFQNRIAKICQRGIVFSSSSFSLAYLVDESGTKSTADRFLDLRKDFSMAVFYDQQEQFDYSLERCYEMVSKTTQKSFRMEMTSGSLVAHKSNRIAMATLRFRKRLQEEDLNSFCLPSVKCPCTHLSSA
ncbi:hypothetical protein CEXT_437401 [Caerostris extrusa]|uniref:Uncharacterized protein n=1 Tax=Caerostris extrusa TaxID=172846 RepID=A0AAV4XUY0_CAEEX|nr:hypothetical protein CEXT_437401 [Caerostris extrusa]